MSFQKTCKGTKKKAYMQIFSTFFEKKEVCCMLIVCGWLSSACACACSCASALRRLAITYLFGFLQDWGSDILFHNVLFF